MKKTHHKPARAAGALEKPVYPALRSDGGDGDAQALLATTQGAAPPSSSEFALLMRRVDDFATRFEDFAASSKADAKTLATRIDGVAASSKASVEALATRFDDFAASTNSRIDSLVASHSALDAKVSALMRAFECQTSATEATEERAATRTFESEARAFINASLRFLCPWASLDGASATLASRQAKQSGLTQQLAFFGRVTENNQGACNDTGSCYACVVRLPGRELIQAETAPAGAAKTVAGQSSTKPASLDKTATQLENALRALRDRAGVADVTAAVGVALLAFPVPAFGGSKRPAAFKRALGDLQRLLLTRPGAYPCLVRLADAGRLLLYLLTTKEARGYFGKAKQQATSSSNPVPAAPSPPAAAVGGDGAGATV